MATGTLNRAILDALRAASLQKDADASVKAFKTSLHAVGFAVAISRQKKKDATRIKGATP